MSRAFALLGGEQRARYVLRQIERRLSQRGHLTEAEGELVARYFPEGAERGPYLRTIREWCAAHGIETDLHREDELSDAGKTLLVRFHVAYRHIDYERPKHDAREQVIGPGGVVSWRQHPWTPSGVLPVPADPEEAWLDFVAWCQGPPMNATEVPLRKDTYLSIFTSPTPPYHAWELRQPDKPAS